MDPRNTGLDVSSSHLNGELPTRTAAAVAAGNLAARLSKVAGGGGGIIGGRVTLALDPNALARLCRDRTVALVTGTNGKTTTTMMLAKAMSVIAPVATNHSGANMPDGLVAALSTDQTAPVGVLEIDENYLPKISDAVQPAVIVLLNLSRDQMDRVGEVRHTERNLRTAIARLRNTTVVANCDDVLVTSAAIDADNTIWVSAGGNWRGDSTSCPRCGMRVHGGATDWYCDCGFARPTPRWSVADGKMTSPNGESFELRLRLPGSANEADATLALAASTTWGCRCGRRWSGSDHHRRRRPVHHAAPQRPDRAAAAGQEPGRLGGDAAAAGQEPGPPGMIIAINGREADGRGQVMLWDVPFEKLQGRTVIATGERSADLAVRLTYADVAHTHVPDPYQAIDSARWRPAPSNWSPTTPRSGPEVGG
ncbi:MurT ligase domain-containing protein [Kutzneria kofuensis]|uniref:MurT ligase domain-containing protein n=1 Tax=Kutzneria kofuensis TaxID=103725 RepID=UPI0031EC484D